MGFTLLPGAPGRVHIHLGCRFGVLGTIPQGASIRAAFLVATVAGINIWTKRDFTLAIVELLEDPFPHQGIWASLSAPSVPQGRNHLLHRRPVSMYHQDRQPPPVQHLPHLQD